MDNANIKIQNRSTCIVFESMATIIISHVPDAKAVLMPDYCVMLYFRKKETSVHGMQQNPLFGRESTILFLYMYWFMFVYLMC